MQTNLKSLPLVYRGKVRECYAVGQDKLLMIASDRISAFDSILSVPIPNKGKVLTQITQFWFDKLTQGMPCVSLSNQNWVICVRTLPLLGIGTLRMLSNALMRSLAIIRSLS